MVHSKCTSLPKTWHSRLETPISTIIAFTWNATTFVNNRKIILTQPVLRAPNLSILWPRLSETGSISADNSMRLRSNAIIPPHLLGINSRPCSNKVLRNLLCLWPTSRPKLSEIPTINKKKYKITFLTYSTLSLSWWNLTCNALTKDMFCHYFYKSLQLSIRLYIDKERQDLNG